MSCVGLLVECARKKVIGKPYEGEPHVRFDEGVLGKSKEETSALLYPSSSLERH
jgi:hypothetical protein